MAKKGDMPPRLAKMDEKSKAKAKAIGGKKAGNKNTFDQIGKGKVPKAGK